MALASSVTRDDVDDAIAELGMLLINAVPASDRHPAQIILLAADRRHIVYVIDDARVEALSMVVEGADAPRIAAILQARFASEKAS